MEWAWVELQGGDVAGAERRMAGVSAALAPPAHPDSRTAGLAQVMAGLIAEARGRFPEAVNRYRVGQRLIAQARAGEADLSFSLVRLGRLLTRMGLLQEAAAPLDQAIARYERLGSAGTARMADALVARAELRAAQGDRRGALEEGRRAHALLRGGLDRGDEGGAFRRGARDALAAHARLLVALDAADPALGPDLLDEAFKVTQEALASRTGEALRQAALRQAAGGGPLAALLRQWTEAADALRQFTVLEGAAAQRGDAEAARDGAWLRAARAAQADALAALDARLEREMPGFGAYARARPAGLRTIQERLAPDDAVIATLTTADGLLLWTLTRESARAVPIPLTDTQMGALVQRVRAGVDPSLAPEGAFLPPFDVEAAQRLYQALIAPAEGLLAGRRHLLLVSDGALQSLPLALLIGGEGQHWLVRRFAVTVMPSLESLAGGGTGRSSSAARSFLGVGDPRLPVGETPQPARPERRRAPPRNLREALERLEPLPETKEELSRIAGLFPAGEKTRLILGDDATKAGLAEAAPGEYSILAFATHAAMAGELPEVSEPAIVLTPGREKLAAGLLTASDIAAMQFNADLVLLSACNTAAAADSGPYAESLSGLARAFLHAGARSLLVSHWNVRSLYTVELTTGFMAALLADPAQRKAVALQSAMLSLLDSPDLQLRDPSVWAPFVLVGE